ncbi:MAG: GGDEF domain-containing protein [Pirellulales bacterium]|nr:GGDEF domain-containing protein [Pirellulales bacterium]
MPTVLLLSADAELVARWEAAASGWQLAVQPQFDIAGTGQSVDVALIDGRSMPPSRPKAETSCWIGSGPAPEGFDCALPPAAGVDELTRTVRLLTSLAMLRRQLRHERRQAAQWLAAAQRDPLTGLAHRGTWNEQLPRCLCEHIGSGCCVALFDLDLFKQVNDSLGHPRGDTVLQAAAGALAQVRPNDLVARLGGDEFALAAPGVTQPQAGALVERLRKAIAQATSATLGRALTCSAGYVWLPPGEPAEPATAIERADRALRRAKQTGRDRTSAAEASEPPTGQ